jgi:PKD domain-containing protein
MTRTVRLLNSTTLVLVLTLVSACHTDSAPPASTQAKATAPAAAPPAGAEALAPTAEAPGANAPPGDELPPDELIIWAEGDPDEGAPPLTVKFTVDPIDDLNNPTWSWDFGDKSPESKEQNPTHTYERAGSYTARVKVTDASGSSGTDEVKIDVEAEAPEKPGEPS